MTTPYPLRSIGGPKPNALGPGLICSGLDMSYRDATLIARTDLEVVKTNPK
jgi:hypothetical protein